MKQYRIVEKPGFIHTVAVQRKFWFGWWTVDYINRYNVDFYMNQLRNPIIKENIS